MGLAVGLLAGLLIWSVDVGAAVPVELPSVEPSAGLVVLPLVGLLVWSVAVAAVVGAVVPVELSGWQAVRAVDSISAARAAPAFRAARGVGLMRGRLSLRCQWSSSGRHRSPPPAVTRRGLPGRGRFAGGAGPPARLTPAGGPGPGPAPTVPRSLQR